jgi:hypothetical protein
MACPAAIVGFMFAAAWARAAEALRRRRGEPHRHEYLRRHRVSVGADRSKTNAIEPRVVVMLSGYALPHGGERVVWLAVSLQSPPEGHVVYATIPFERSTRRGAPDVGDAVPTPELATEIAALLSATNLTAPRPKLKGVRDGFPFTLEAYRDGADRSVRFEGNLAASNWREDGACRLADAILRAADAGGARRALFGACSNEGDITIDER